MVNLIKYFHHRLVTKLILTVGLTLLLSISTWAYFNIDYQKEKLMDEIVQSTDRLTNTIKLGAHYSMMLNSRDDINQIINNIARQKEIENIRIYNKEGEIKFSNETSEVDRMTNIKAEACDICHRTEPPLTDLKVSERIRIFNSRKGYRLLGIISPIRNEPGCATDACHVHPEGKKILGALDVVVSLRETDNEILTAEKGIIGLAMVLFLLTSTIIFIIVLKFVSQPVKKLIDGTRQIAKGDLNTKLTIDQADEMGQLAVAINQMGKEIQQKQAELNKQRNEYQTLFERTPCLITVQDRDYRLLRFNQDFAERFDPRVGDHCYKAYKGQDYKCVNCPVERTFIDGLPHFGEESGVNKDGTEAHWIFRTSPIFDADGQVVAAMEMSLDITERKLLERKLEKSERKYHEIFNNIPNPVFVLDFDTLEILDCNESVTTDYAFMRDELLNTSFLDLFVEQNREPYRRLLRTSTMLNQVKHRGKGDKTLFVNIRISPSEFPGKKVLLVTTSDITKRLEAEQQLIQASKMATLGEMATGIAHELNQPLSVIKTASSFFVRKISKGENLDHQILHSMLEKVDKNVDRAANIINHMRQFARKSDLSLDKVQVNDVLKSAFDIFSQQLKVRGIEVVWDIDGTLPKILADPGRLEQVFINLLLNARDAIEEKSAAGRESGEKKITLKTWRDGQRVIAEVRDTGGGIPKAIEDKLFEPFFTTKQVGKGTGLGLSISYGIVKDCGGDIKAASRGDEGAVFYVTFPIPSARKTTATDEHPHEQMPDGPTTGDRETA
ncbi:MAG: ATP-binding protein [Desulfobacterales bacterium]|nr:ATP-binding protein [Desulfobacterales bacterium]